MYLVNADFIKENSDVVIIDCRYDMTNPPLGYQLYREGHIEGAYYVDLDKDMTSEVKEHGGRHPLIDLDIFINQMRSFGIKKTSKIVIYDDGELAMASRLWFMLSLIGLKPFIVKGGFKALQSSLNVTQIVPELMTSDLEASFNESLICDKEAVKDAMNNDRSVIIDSRSKERYLGLEEPFDKIAGHIPTAVNYFWKDNFENGTVKNYGDLQAMFLEMDNYEDIIIHCGSGITGCVNMFFLNELGIKSRLYAGSYSDWVSYDEHEIIVEDNVRQKVKA